MSTLESRYTLSEEMGRCVVLTQAANEQTLASGMQWNDTNRSGWQAIIDKWLIEWGRNPGSLEDEGLIPPSEKTIDLACQVAVALRDKGVAAPLRVVTNGEGGIVFEHSSGTWFSIIEVHPDGNIELATFRNSELKSRERLSLC